MHTHSGAARPTWLRVPPAPGAAVYAALPATALQQRLHLVRQLAELADEGHCVNALQAAAEYAGLAVKALHRGHLRCHGVREGWVGVEEGGMGVTWQMRVAG